MACDSVQTCWGNTSNCMLAQGPIDLVTVESCNPSCFRSSVCLPANFRDDTHYRSHLDKVTDDYVYRASPRWHYRLDGFATKCAPRLDRPHADAVFPDPAQACACTLGQHTVNWAGASRPICSWTNLPAYTGRRRRVCRPSGQRCRLLCFKKRTAAISFQEHQPASSGTLINILDSRDRVCQDGAKLGFLQISCWGFAQLPNHGTTNHLG